MEEKVDSSLGVEGSIPDRDWHFCKIFRTAETVDSYVLIPSKSDQNDKKNVGALIGFGEVKPTQTDNSYV